MLTFYLIIIAVLFFLAISDLVVGVSNDAVNFLNSAIGAKAGSFKMILFVAALGIIVGATFSSGMMEVARKGIFHPQYFYFSEIIILFLAVMVTDVILLDAFNTFGMPTSTTVSIVFELLGAAVAITAIKVFTDPNALQFGEYINSGKALAIISGILLSVVIAFAAGAIIQYLSRLLFSFNYEKSLKHFGALWGGMAIAAITYFILVKGSKGASFMTEETKDIIASNSLTIIAISFVGWTLILQLLNWITRFDILKFVVLIGTFALAMAFAGNDLVNFIGVPLAGFNSYQLFLDSGGTGAENYLMEGLAGKVATPTFLLLLAGLIMVITLWTSKKARSVVKTSLDLGRQNGGYERFSASFFSRSLVRSFIGVSSKVNKAVPSKLKQKVRNQFDERPFVEQQSKLGKEAPSFDMVRASVTLVVASILISIGTTMKLPLSTTYVTFMVFMGTSLADGAWGRESAVYRVSGVLSVIGGWFFTALSAFTLAFIIATLFHFGGAVAIILILALAAMFIYRTHKYHNGRLEEQKDSEEELDEGSLTSEKAVDLSIKNLTTYFGGFTRILDQTINGLETEDRSKLKAAFEEFKRIYKQCKSLNHKARKTLDRIPEKDIESGHFYILVVDYLLEMACHVSHIIKPSLDHVSNHHKPLLPEQMTEIKVLHSQVKAHFDAIIGLFKHPDASEAARIHEELSSFVKSVRTFRKNQIKRIKHHEIGTRNSLLFLNHLGEFRNLFLFLNSLIKVFDDLIIHAQEEETFRELQEEPLAE
jgi:phosphate/sulfate permease